MPFLEFLARVIEAIAWPATVMGIIYLLREPLTLVVPLIEQFQYKELTVCFRHDAEAALKAVEAEAPELDRLEVVESEISDPRIAVIDAWRELEATAIEKFRQLVPSKDPERMGPERVLGYFEYMGALIPRTEQTLSQLRRLRNQAVHSPQQVVPLDGAKSFVKAARLIQSQIEALPAFPRMKLNKLTLLILEYNHLLDTGKYGHITIRDIHREIEQGTVLRFIRDVAAEDADLSLYLDMEDELGFEAEYARHLQSIYGGYAGQERRKWGVENSGLCLLIAWTNEIIQQGGGWQPNENVA